MKKGDIFPLITKARQGDQNKATKCTQSETAAVCFHGSSSGKDKDLLIVFSIQEC